MKLHLPLSLRSSLLACMAFAGFTMGAAAYDAKTDLGDVMYVGDSITHGVNSASYRWALHKIFVDNNINYNEVGVQTGNFSGGVAAGSSYGNRAFKNLHASQSSERAFEIAGRTLGNGGGNRLGGTGILQWLNLDPNYTGPYHIGENDRPSTYFMMIGTNDLLSENGNISKALEATQRNLIGEKQAGGSWTGKSDMDTIIDAMREKSGASVDIVLLTVPTWVPANRSNNALPADVAAVAQYNQALKEWAEWKGVTLIQSDKGIIDVADTTYPGGGVASMFNSDKLHPNAQGDLIIAGNVAKGLGYAGRTAGQLRKEAASFAWRASSPQTLAAGQSISHSWGGDVEGGFTVDFTLGGLGNGATGGWNTVDNFSVSVGDGLHSGTLNINEAYIKWGSTILYSMDMSELTDSLRVAYVYGNATQGLASGFYIWLDDQLIGEGLAASGTEDGLRITNGTGSDVTLSSLAMDGTGSWAPSTQGMENGNPLIEGDSGDFPGRKSMAKAAALQNPGGTGGAAVVGTDSTNVSLSGKGDKNLIGNLRNWLWDSSAGAEGRVVGGTLTGDHRYSDGASSFFGVTKGNYTGDIYVNIEGTIWNGGFMGFYRGGAGVGQADNGILQGNGYLRFGEFTPQNKLGTIFGTVNAGTGGIDGDLYIEFSGAPSFTVAGQDYGVPKVSVVGVFNSRIGIKGEFRVVVNSGTFEGKIIGGAVVTNNASDSGTVAFYLNGGNFKDSIYAGGAFGSVAGSHIVITGNNANFENSITISAGGLNDNANGSVRGNARVTLSKVTSSESGIGAFSGTISGGWKPEDSTAVRTLEFSATTLETLNAQITNFDVIELTNAAEVTLSSFGGATRIFVSQGSELILPDGEIELEVLNNQGTVTLSEGVTLRAADAGQVDMQGMYGTFVLGANSCLELGANVSGHYTVDMAEGSALSVAGSNTENSYEVTAAADSVITVESGAAGDFHATMSGSEMSVCGGEDASYTLEMSEGANLAVEAGSHASYDVSLEKSSMTVSGGSGIYEVTLLDGSELNVNGGDAEYSVEMSGSSMTVAENTQGSYDVTMSDGSELTVNGGDAAYSVEMSGGSELTVNGGQGKYTVNAEDDGNKVIIGGNAEADFNLTMGADSAVTVGAGATGNYSITYTGGGYNILDSRDAGISGVVVLGGGGEYDMKGGLAADLKLTLPEVASERRVVNMGSGDVTLSGENYIRLSSSMKDQAEAALDTKGQLLLDKDATLHINVNDIAGEVLQQQIGTYYLTNGDLSSFRAAGTAEKIVFDAAATVLGWKITYREDGAIRFASSDSNIYQSSTDNEGAGWGSTNGRSVYETVPAHKAILLDRATTLDLSNEEAPDGVESLVMHNLIGGSGSSLTVKDNARKSKITISNSISENDKALFKDKFDMTVEDSLTFDGNITLINVGLEVKHENPDKQVEGVAVGAPESRFIVGGDLVMLGNREVELTCGVLELHGTGNNLGGGGVVFNGAMGQLVIAGQQALTRVSGAVELAPDTEATEREHIVLTDGATLELCGGATVGRGIAIGGDAGGTLAVSGSATIASESKLQNVVLRVEEFGALHVGMTSPQDRALSNEPNRALAGLEGSGKLSADAADMEITVVGGDRVFGGDLSAYAGTMTINASKHSQVFSGSGLKGNSAWSLTNKAGGHLTLNLAESGNKLTMGRLDLQSDSHTCILFDLTEMSAGSGLQLTQLNIAKNAHVTVGQAEGLIALEGAVGEEVTLAAIRVSDAAASAVATSEVDWQLQNIKNDDGHVYTEYDSAAGVLYLKTRVETLNSYLDFAQNVNAKAGAELLGGISSAEIGGDLAGVDAAVARLLRGENGKKAANVAEANRIMAAAAGASVAVVGQALIGDVERQLRAIRNRTTNFSAGEGSETSVWLNAEGDYHKMDADGMLPGYKVNSWGGTVGAARSVGRSAEVGLALTAMYADLESEGPDRLKGDMDTYYLSAYAQVARGAWRHTLVATVGTANIDAKRSVNYGEGSYTTSGSTDGTSFGALYEVGYSIPLGAESAVCLQPVMNVAVRCTKLAAYTERGSTAALDVDAQKNTVVTLGFGARMQAALDSNFWNRTTYFEGRALVKVDCGDSEAKSRVAFHEAAATHATVRSAERGSVGVELGAGLTVPVGRSGEVFVDVGAELWSGYTNANAAAGYKITF